MHLEVFALDVKIDSPLSHLKRCASRTNELYENFYCKMRPRGSCAKGKRRCEMLRRTFGSKTDKIPGEQRILSSTTCTSHLLFYADLNKDDRIGQVSWENKKYTQISAGKCYEKRPRHG
jgi:hypothetical protein